MHNQINNQSTYISQLITRFKFKLIIKINKFNFIIIKSSTSNNVYKKRSLTIFEKFN